MFLFFIVHNVLLAGSSSGFLNVNFQLTVKPKNRKKLLLTETPELRLPAVSCCPFFCFFL
jgi:hypothetical protein